MHPRHIALHAALILLLLAPAAALAGGSENEEIVMPAAAPEITAVPFVPSALSGAPLETVPPQMQSWPMTAVAAPAQEGGTVALLDAPSIGAGVVMTYYAGTRLTALREAKPGFLLVQTGTEEAGAMGYMRRSELRFGSTALREAAPEYMMIELNRDADVYAWCDEGSGVIGSFAAGERFFAIGKNDGKWVQIAVPGSGIVTRRDVYEWLDTGAQGTRADGMPGITCGFVRMETGLGRGYPCIAERWEVEPVPGEITREQAFSLAVQAALQLDLPEELRTETALRARNPQATWMYSMADSGFVQLSVNVTLALDEALSVSVNLRGDGSIITANRTEDGVILETFGGLP